LTSANSEIKDPEQFLKAVNAFRISRIILTASELRVFDHLCSPGKKSGELALILGTKPRATDRLLNALVAIGLLSKHSGIFSNTTFAESYLVSVSPGYFSGLALTNHTWKTWSTLTDALYAGKSVVFEKPINERPKEWQEVFIEAMHRRAHPQAVEAADALDLKDVKRILDVGGGSGAFTLEFLKRNPEMTGVIFDLPNIVEITRRFVTLLTPDPSPDSHYLTPGPSPDRHYLTPGPSPMGEGSLGQAEARIKDRIAIIAGDYLKDDFGTGFDLVFMSAIIHINSPDENRLLIRKGADSLNPGGQLVILDHIMSDDRTEPSAGAIFAINMLVGTLHGDTYTEKEIRSWIQDAGLRDIKMETTHSGIQLLSGRKGTIE
jgi:SAM-dependent methyltransferase